MSKRELVFAAFDNKVTERVPVGFWYHYAPDALFDDSAETIKKNIEGHQRFVDEFKPDFLKLMSDGYFAYENETLENIKSAEDLYAVKAVGAKQWIDAQVQLVKELTDRFGKEIPSFYNIFAPASYFKFQLTKVKSPLTVAQLLKENPEGVKHALNEIAKDIADLAARVIKEGHTDGIYFSVQNIQDDQISKDIYLNYVAPSEKTVLEAANALSDYSILHICGYEGSRNDLTTYVDYPAKVINWAVTVEGASLKEGKSLFGNRAVIGGFNNTKDGVLYKGTKEEIEAYTEGLIKDAGSQGIILGADCTIPEDTPFEHLDWVREKAKLIS